MKRIFASLFLILCVLAFVACDGTSNKADDETAGDEQVEPEITPPLLPPPPVVQPEPEPEPETEYKGGFTKEQRISDAKLIVSIMDRTYAPRKWKEESFGVSFEDASRALIERAGEDISDLEFYDAMARYFAAFHDTHVSFSIPSSKASYLGIDVDNIDGHVIVTYVDKYSLGRDFSAIEVGDEVLAIDGTDVNALIEELLPYDGEGNPVLERRFTTSRLTYRSQSSITKLPEGKAVVTVESYRTGDVKDVEMEWIVEGYELAPYNDPGIELSKRSSAKKILAKDSDDAFNKNESFVGKRRIRLMQSSPLSKHAAILGYSRPFFPLWEDFEKREDAPLFTGVVNINGKRIGFIRIPHYVLNATATVEELEKEIKYFEQETDALIIDQTNNPGGGWCLALKIASFFFTRQQPDVLEYLRANRSNLMWLEYNAKYADNEDDKKLADEIARGMRKDLEDGEFLSGPYAICSISGVVDPYQNKDGERVVYTKPVLMLINDLSISAGDLFPAMMQDAGRMTMFGTTTAGAGGYVLGSEGLGFSEVSIRYTCGMAVRTTDVTLNSGVTTNFVENVGVRPDIEQKITVEDFRNGYVGYRNAVERAVLSLVE